MCSSSWNLRATEHHLPYGITQCYLPLTQVSAPRLNPSHAGWYSIYLPRRDGRLSSPCYSETQPPGVELATYLSRTQRPNHWATKQHTCCNHCSSGRWCVAVILPDNAAVPSATEDQLIPPVDHRVGSRLDRRDGISICLELCDRCTSGQW